MRIRWTVPAAGDLEYTPGRRNGTRELTLTPLPYIVGG
jgi:hypothetical protein